MATIKINGMSCNHCVMAVHKALKKGVKSLIDLSYSESIFAHNAF